MRVEEGYSSPPLPPAADMLFSLSQQANQFMTNQPAAPVAPPPPPPQVNNNNNAIPSWLLAMIQQQQQQQPTQAPTPAPVVPQQSSNLFSDHAKTLSGLASLQAALPWLMPNIGANISYVPNSIFWREKKQRSFTHFTLYYLLQTTTAFSVKSRNVVQCRREHCELGICAGGRLTGPSNYPTGSGNSPAATAKKLSTVPATGSSGFRSHEGVFSKTSRIPRCQCLEAGVGGGYGGQNVCGFPAPATTKSASSGNAFTSWVCTTATSAVSKSCTDAQEKGFTGCFGSKNANRRGS